MANRYRARMLSLIRDPDSSDPGRFFLVKHSHLGIVGRIYDKSDVLPKDATHPWFWGLSHPHEGRIRVPHYGHATSRHYAMLAFKERWLLSYPE